MIPKKTNQKGYTVEQPMNLCCSQQNDDEGHVDKVFS